MSASFTAVFEVLQLTWSTCFYTLGEAWSFLIQLSCHILCRGDYKFFFCSITESKWSSKFKTNFFAEGPFRPYKALVIATPILGLLLEMFVLLGRLFYHRSLKVFPVPFFDYMSMPMASRYWQNSSRILSRKLLLYLSGGLSLIPSHLSYSV